MHFVAKLTLILIAFVSSRMRGELSSTESDRLAQIAGDIWGVVESSEDNLFDGEAGREMSALLLAATAAQETGLDRQYQTCEGCPIGGRRCDGGRSVTLYQLHQGAFAWGPYTRDELCGNNALATERAYHVLLAHRKHRASVPGLFCAYQGARSLSPAAREKVKYFNLFAKKAGLKIYRAHRRLAADWLPGFAPYVDEDDEPDRGSDPPLWWEFSAPAYASL